MSKGRMKYKYELNWWDQFDQDRWISSFVSSFVLVLLTFFILRNIPIPKLPKKLPQVAEFEFVTEKVQKKVFPRKVNPVQEQVQQKIFEEEPEVVIEIPEPIVDQATNLPQNLVPADQLQIFEQQSDETPISAPEFQVADGEIAPINDDATIEMSDGFESDWTQENVPTTVITTRHGDRSNSDVNSGISTTIRTERRNSKVHFSGFQGEIDWSELLNPLLDWIGKNSTDIGLVPKKFLTNDDINMKTARHLLKINGRKYELLLASNEAKRQVTICMIDTKTDEFVLLVDQGLTQTSNIFKTGKVRRNSSGNIVDLKLIQKAANNKLAQERMGQFWSWAKTLQ